MPNVLNTFCFRKGALNRQSVSYVQIRVHGHVWLPKTREEQISFFPSLTRVTENEEDELVVHCDSSDNHSSRKSNS